jgi:hypothetical protein
MTKTKPRLPHRSACDHTADHLRRNSWFARALELSPMEQQEPTMAEKFDPAPHDKLAEDPKQAIAADKDTHDELEKGLKDTFPASDPVSTTQPNKTLPGKKD